MDRVIPKCGKLTIFTSYAPGAGKTYAMLQAALKEKQAGRDVVIASLDGEQWPQTKKFAQQFETVPCRANCEIDSDAFLARNPQIVLVDDLAHSNSDSSRHMKRYQDVDELLKAGLNVYATLNIQHIESLQDTMRSILGDSADERIPDYIFDEASQVEFIDIEPVMLQKRLQEQKDEALLEKYPLSRLNALREVALRRCADRAALYTQGMSSRAPYHTHEHILVCLSTAPSNEKIIRTAARMAAAFRCGLTALFVETSDFQRIKETDRESLRSHIHLAQQMGASVETVYGDDVAYQIAEFSRLSGVTKIVLGRSEIPLRFAFRKASLSERLIELAPELDIHIIPDRDTEKQFVNKHREIMRMPSVSILDLVKSAGFLILATLIGILFYNLGFTEANIITLYILGVMLVSVSTKSSVCSFIASIVSVLTFNFFFTYPRFTFHAYDSSYPVTFLVMFLASLITGSLASRLKSHAKRSAQVAWRTKLLFETNQKLQKERTQADIFCVTAAQLLKIFQRDIITYQIEGERLKEPAVLKADNSALTDRYISPKEREVAQWVATNNKRAGAGTETFSDSCCTYFSIRTGEHVYGVVGIAAADKPLDSFESGILLSVLGECALALENQKNLEEKEAAAVLAKNEQLRANLLRSISHDLRTPLTSISGNASNLLSNGDLFDENAKRQMYTDIYDDSMWMINLVENLLSVSRLEQGRMNLHVSTELIDEVVAEALRHVNRKSAEYHITVQNTEEYLLAQIDAKLIVQVLINLIDNAIKYTPVGSQIDIRWEKQGSFVFVSVADNGPGVSDQAKPRIFDMFYSASNEIVDSRRSMGLGLALCKSIVNAHGGEITVSDCVPHGAVFTFSVPSGEVELHE